MAKFVVTVHPHHTIEVSGAVAVEDVEDLRSAAAPLLAHRPKLVTVDLSGVTSASPRFAAWLLDIARAVQWVVLHSPSSAVHRLLDVAGVANLFVFQMECVKWPHEAVVVHRSLQARPSIRMPAGNSRAVS